MDMSRKFGNYVELNHFRRVTTTATPGGDFGEFT